MNSGDDRTSRRQLPLRCMEIWSGSHAVENAVTMPGLEAWVYSTPFEGSDSGGDVHYVSLCGGGIVTRLIVADVSGHGASVAEVSGSLRALMRKNINSKSQTKLVEALNRQFADLAHMQRFATAVVATYLATKRSFTVCNAGHPRPLWYRAATGEWSLMDRQAGEASATNLPLGVDEDSPYDQFAVSLGRGDVILIYTDAFIEASDPTGRMLGEAGLLDLARTLDPTQPRSIGSGLLAAAARHRNGQPADDDVTLLVLHHDGHGPRRPSIGQKLDVYAKVFGLKRV